MALTNFGGLKVSIAGWLMRDDLTDSIPDFISLANQTIQYGTDDVPPLRTAEMEATAAGVTDAAGFADLPPDFLEYRAVQGAPPGYPALQYVTPGSQIGRYPGSPASGFSIVGRQLRIYPAGIGDIVLSYYAKIPELSDAAPTNWLLTKAPGVYLYGALLHSAPFLGDDQRLATWAALYSKHVAGLRSSDIGARFAQARARVRGPTP